MLALKFVYGGNVANRCFFSQSLRRVIANPRLFRFATVARPYSTAGYGNSTTSAQNTEQPPLDIEDPMVFHKIQSFTSSHLPPPSLTHFVSHSTPSLTHSLRLHALTPPFTRSSLSGDANRDPQPARAIARNLEHLHPPEAGKGVQGQEQQEREERG